VVAIANGKMPLPADPQKRAVLEQLAERYKAKLEKKGVGDSKIPQAENIPIEDLLSPAEIRTIRKGTPGEKNETLPIHAS